MGIRTLGTISSGRRVWKGLRNICKESVWPAAVESSLSLSLYLTCSLVGNSVNVKRPMITGCVACRMSYFIRVAMLEKNHWKQLISCKVPLFDCSATAVTKTLMPCKGSLCFIYITLWLILIFFFSNTLNYTEILLASNSVHCKQTLVVTD